MIKSASHSNGTSAAADFMSRAFDCCFSKVPTQQRQPNYESASSESGKVAFLFATARFSCDKDKNNKIAEKSIAQAMFLKKGSWNQVQ